MCVYVKRGNGSKKQEETDLKFEETDQQIEACWGVSVLSRFCVEPFPCRGVSVSPSRASPSKIKGNNIFNNSPLKFLNYEKLHYHIKSVWSTKNCAPCWQFYSEKCYLFSREIQQKFRPITYFCFHISMIKIKNITFNIPLFMWLVN